MKLLVVALLSAPCSALISSSSDAHARTRVIVAPRKSDTSSLYGPTPAARSYTPAAPAGYEPSVASAVATRLAEPPAAPTAPPTAPPADPTVGLGYSYAGRLDVSFETMPGKFGWAAYSEIANWAESRPGMSRFFREAEIKHCRVAMLAAAGFPIAEFFHPFFGGSIAVPSYLAFQQSLLQEFWPLFVCSIGVIEAATSIPTFEDPSFAMWRIKQDHIAGDFGFDPLGFSKRVDLRDEELAIGRIAMLAIAIMVVQELNAKVSIYLWWTERAFVLT